MFKKVTSAVTISALAALSLVSIAGASTGYASFDIANGDNNEEVQNSVSVPSSPAMLNIGAGDDGDMPTAVLDYTNFTIANGDENEEGTVGRSKVQASPVSAPAMLNIGGGDDNDQPTSNGNNVKLNIGASDPAEQD